MVKYLPAMQETCVQSLGWEDPLEKGIVNPLQYSCLENPSGREAWQATVRGVTENQTQLSDLHTYLTTVSNSSPFLGHIACIIFMSLCIHTTLL